MNISIARVGFSEKADSYEAGVDVASNAANGSLSGWHMAILISTSRHVPEKLRDGVQSVIGKSCKLIGGYGVGIITNSNLAYDGYQVGILLISFSSNVDFEIFLAEKLAENETDVGKFLGKTIQAKPYRGEPSVILLYDSVNRLSGSFKMNMATYLLQGMREELAAWPRLVGAGMVGDMQCRETYQWFNNDVLQQSALALVFSGGMRIDSTVLHGCKPASSYHQITQTDENVVLEIDGVPALDKIAELLGKESGKTWRDYSFFVTLGVNRGERFSKFDEELYANRLCMGVDEARKGLVMFEPDLLPGTEVQLMRRDMDFGYIREKVANLLNGLNGRKPVFAFYIDCAGRAASYSGFELEEAAEVQKALGDIPLLGFYSGVEIGNVAGEPIPLDWTGVLAIASEEEFRNLDAAHIRGKIFAQGEMPCEFSGAAIDEPYALLSIDELRKQLSESAEKLLTLEKQSVYYANLTDELAGQNVKNDSNLSMLNNELRLKKQGFAILANLQANIKEGQTLERLCQKTIHEINATLKMDKTLVLLRENGEFYPAFWGGISDKEVVELKSVRLPYDAAWMHDGHILANRKAGKTEIIQQLKAKLPFLFFVGVPILEGEQTIGLLISARMKEVKPFFPPLEKGDIDSFVAIAGFLSSTNQLNKQRGHLEQLNRTLEQRVLERTADLHDALGVVEQKNKQIEESINYAKIIQSAVLPSVDVINDLFDSHFIIWEPKDIVSGDIYAVERVSGGFVVCVVDCTGHGVPGAFMTMITMSSIKQILSDPDCPGPAEMLKRLNRQIRLSLYHHSDESESQVDDGLEIGVCWFDLSKSEMIFSAARFPLLIAQGGAVTLLEGDRQKLGYKASNVDYDFKEQVIRLEAGQRFYMYSDGFVDQVGASRFPFGKKRLHNLINENQHLDFTAQQAIYRTALLQHQSGQKRRDDVTMIGWEISKP
ncbi:MAG: hypothetical protein EPO42_01790 [Gallionellaceae bacterium]|nr:MAG: hypothetical protein EPO42_01790 [Gallionellaceae bacterium]